MNWLHVFGAVAALVPVVLTIRLWVVILRVGRGAEPPRAFGRMKASGAAALHGRGRRAPDYRKGLSDDA
jgi:hypothetical protein